MKTLLKTKLLLLGVMVLSLVALPYGMPPAQAQTSKASYTLLPLATRTAAATGTAVNLSNHPANKVIAYLSSGAGSGGTVTLDVKLQDSPDGVIWADIASGAFTQVTTAAVVLRLAPAAAVGRFIRAISAQGAGSTFAYQVKAVTYFSATASLNPGWPALPEFERDVGLPRRVLLPIAA